jgi:hypothetical protein
MGDNDTGYHHKHAVDKGITRVDHSNAPNGLPPPIRGDAPISPRPHDAGFRQPVKITPSSARPANDMGPGLLPANGSIDSAPHPYTPAAQKQAANTYGKVPHR